MESAAERLMQTRAQSKENTKLVLKLAGLCAAMFVFGFALVPLYDVFCAITGLGGKTEQTAAQVAALPLAPEGERRTVRVEFLASSARQAPWEFRAAESRMEVELGKLYETEFVARNLTGEAITAQAVPSVAPGLAARHFRKIDCFCFTTQPFAPEEERELKLVFMVDPALPEHMDTVSLSYTLFAVDE
jgi:cytochrome c oxidase assembly protein subunit 11